MDEMASEDGCSPLRVEPPNPRNLRAVENQSHHSQEWHLGDQVEEPPGTGISWSR